MSDNNFYILSAKEYPVFKKCQKFKDNSLKFLAQPIIFLKITPNMVTFASFVCALLFAYFFILRPYIAFVFFSLHVGLDAIDGLVARLTNKATRGGSFLDLLNDHTGFIVVVGTLVFYNFLNPILGFIYAYLYSLLWALLIYCNNLRIPPKFTFKTKYFFYIVYILYAFSGVNFFQPAVIVFTILTVPFTVAILLRVVSYLNRK